MRYLLFVCLSFACLLFTAGCPTTPQSTLPLAGDPRIVGTWVVNDVDVLGYHFNIQTTYDASGSYTAVWTCREDNSAGSSNGKWYADPQLGYLDTYKESTFPKNPDAIGLVKCLYEIDGDTLYSWNNPVNMDRPATREEAAASWVETRKTSKDALEAMPVARPGIIDGLMEYMR